MLPRKTQNKKKVLSLSMKKKLSHLFPECLLLQSFLRHNDTRIVKKTNSDSYFGIFSQH